MAFKREHRPKPSVPSKHSIQKPRSKQTSSKHGVQKFRDNLDTSFEALWTASAVKKLAPVPAPKKKQKISVVKKADIDASIDRLASLMQGQ
jgi:hypothetical protein